MLKKILLENNKQKSELQLLFTAIIKAHFYLNLS